MTTAESNRATETVAVVSLVIMRTDRRGEVLLGVRQPTPTSPRHPSVLSSPTMRVPMLVMDAALETFDVTPPSVGEMRRLVRDVADPIGVENSMRGVIAYLAETLLARKLGAGPSLINGDLTGSARLGAIAHDVVTDPESGRPDETTLMLTIVVSVEAGADLIPRSTESYSRLDWVPAARLGAAVRNRDPLMLIEDVDLLVCLHGLCVRSASFWLE